MPQMLIDLPDLNDLTLYSEHENGYSYELMNLKLPPHIDIKKVEVELKREFNRFNVKHHAQAIRYITENNSAMYKRFVEIELRQYSNQSGVQEFIGKLFENIAKSKSRIKTVSALPTATFHVTEGSFS
jgi:hypothetical protein